MKSVDRAMTAVAYAMVAVAFFPIALSGEIGVLSPIAFVIALIASLIRNPLQATPRPLTAKLWTGALLLAAAGLIAWSIQDSNWLLHTLQFALLLTVSRFFQRRFAKDFLQLIALSFVLLLVGAIVHPGPSFAAGFLLYTVLTMWGLTILHLTREIEIHTRTGPEFLAPEPPGKRRWFGLRRALPPPPPDPWPEPMADAHMLTWRSRRLLTKRFLAVLSALALGVLVISALFFFLFPRLGIGFFFAQTRGSHSVTGFGQDAQLGNFGQIKTSADVVARITFPKDPKRLEQPVRLRGTSFENFVGNGWTRPTEASRDLLMDVDGRYIVPWAGQADPKTDQTYEAEVFLEPLGQDVKVLFAPPRTKAIAILDAKFDIYRGRTRRVARTSTGDLTYRLSSAFTKAPPDMALHYAVEVIETKNERLDDDKLRAAEGDPSEAFTERWTKIPETLDKRIPELAKRMMSKANTRYDRALAVQEGLRAGWLYSLKGDQDDDKPLTDFLFGKKYGHCEYFATAMTLMLRTQGIPARVVHGFAGGVYNPFGSYRMIRQADAHSWVEVYFQDFGWRTFDPTPPGGQVPPEETGFTAALHQLSDGASLLWYQWIVEYDLERQVELVKNMANLLPSSVKGNQFGTAGDSSSQRPSNIAKAQAQRVLLLVGALALILGLLYLLWILRRWRRKQLHWDVQVERATAGLQRQLQRAGHARATWETWSLVAARLRTIDQEVGEAIQQFADAYDRARYAPTDPQALTWARKQARTAATRAKRLPKQLR